MQRLNTSCSTIITDFDSKVANATKTFADSTKQPLADFDKSNKTFATSLTQLTSLYNDFKSAIAEVKTIKDVLTRHSEELKKSQGEQDVVLNEIKVKIVDGNNLINSHIRQIKELCSSINTAADTINTSVISLNTKTDNLSSLVNTIGKKISDEQKSTDNKIESIQSELSKTVNVNRWLIIAGIIAAVILHFV